MHSVRFLKVIPCHPCSTADPQFSSLFSTSFSALAPGSSTSPSLLYPRGVHQRPLCKEGHALADWLNSTLSQVMSPSLRIDVSREHTPIILLSRRGSLDTNVGDLATTLDASEVCDTTDVGRLTSPLFSQEPVRCLLFSDTSKHGDIQARC